MSLNQTSRVLSAADRDARHEWPDADGLLAKRAFQLGFAKGLLADFIAAAEAPADVRAQMIKYAAVRARRELGEKGRLA